MYDRKWNIPTMANHGQANVNNSHCSYGRILWQTKCINLCTYSVLIRSEILSKASNYNTKIVVKFPASFRLILQKISMYCSKCTIGITAEQLNNGKTQTCEKISKVLRWLNLSNHDTLYATWSFLWKWKICLWWHFWDSKASSSKVKFAKTQM